ncbi:histone-lysine N-methyltransferase SETMAR [Trichonephila clavata]|uniref:Histone-lysine N-methyltransferase SETMAR n=1 Tax=Trichonephila clavata TaxID=2740835 RepID=A0A8X6FDS9_TRICU|nr:histone-lysine N-methyltransferase SETMAR [Trichonephila clavata]
MEASFYAIEFCVRLQKSALETFDMVREDFSDKAMSRASIFGWQKACKEVRQNVKGIVYQHAVEPGTTVNGLYYANVLRTMVRHVKRKRPLLRNGFLFHHDNDRPHIARCVLYELQQNIVEILPHSPYTPDLTPCNFRLFPQLKKPLRGKHFASNKACVKVAEAVLKKLSQNGLIHVFKK